MSARDVLLLAALLIAGSGAVHAAQANEDRSAAGICAHGTVTPRFQYPSDACWVAFDVALARNAVDDAIAAVRTGCNTHHRADYCLLASWIDERQRQRPLRRVSTARRTSLTSGELAQLADQITTWEWDDALIGLIGRQQQ